MSENIGKGRVLVVDDEPHQRTILKEAVQLLNYKAVVAETGVEALSELRAGTFDALITDLMMPGMDGVALLEKAHEIDPSLSVVVVTAHGTVETAVAAMKKGAEDYLLKPIDFNVLEIVLSRIFSRRALVREKKQLESENQTLKQSLGIRYHLANTLGKSAQTVYLLELVRAQLANRAPLLISGERGVGKSDVARMIHYNSPWASNDLIFFDCAAVPPELQENHLFGDEQDEDVLNGRPGLVEKATQGTLVIENVHQLAERCQPRLARLLAEGKAQRTGGKRFFQVDVRIIATSQATRLRSAMADGTFRSDAAEPLLANTLQVHPLRERREDIPVLIAATARQIAGALGKEISKIDPAVIEKLSAYDFPGNVQELRALVESAVMHCTTPNLRLEDFVLLAPASS